MEQKTFIPLFDNHCVSCGHLVKKAKTLYENCHFSKGNESCPAKILYIGVGVKNKDKAAAQIAGAIINEDATKLEELATRLAKYEPSETRDVLKQVRELVLNSYGVVIDGDGELMMEEAETDGDDEDADVEEEAEDGGEVEVEEDEDDEIGEAALNDKIDERVKLQLIALGVLSLESGDVGVKEANSPVLALEQAVANGALSDPSAAAEVVEPSTVKKTVADEDDWSESAPV